MNLCPCLHGRSLACFAPILLLAAFALSAVAEDTPKVGEITLDKRLQDEEARRVAAIEKAKPSVVAIFAAGGAGGGSGVLIDEDGYALTNFHVVEGSGAVMKCGLPDGVFYDGVLVGLDKVGDVALIKLLPKKEGDKTYPLAGKGKFPFAKLGDSDKLKAGDWSLAMGNPFLLATDFTPTVTFGLVSGVHRFQYPSGTFLEYTDCIQIDTSINPGNSGGPLFNMDGELVGINGRGSFEKRGRVNSGVGYAISINQIKNFMGQLRAGMDTDHASLGALIASDMEDPTLEKMKVQAIIECDAKRRGLQDGDQIVSFAGRPVSTVNEYKNILGIFPKGWRLPLTYRREEKKTQILVRLMGVQRQEIPGKDPEADKKPAAPQQPKVVVSHPMYKAKDGFANFYFNEQARNRLLAGFKKTANFTDKGGDWTFRATGDIRGVRGSALIAIKHQGAKNEKDDVIAGSVGGIDQNLEPLKQDLKLDELHEPIGSGGLLIALYHYRQLLTQSGKDLMQTTHGGNEPYYLPATGPEAPDYTKLRVDAEVLRTSYAGVAGKWYFQSQKDGTYQLLGFEITVERDDDPCEVALIDYVKEGDNLVPSKMLIRHGNGVYANFNQLTIKRDAAKTK